MEMFYIVIIPFYDILQELSAFFLKKRCFFIFRLTFLECKTVTHTT